MLGYALTHTPSGGLIASFDDPEELLFLGEELLTAVPASKLRSKSIDRTSRALGRIFAALHDADKWPAAWRLRP